MAEESLNQRFDRMGRWVDSVEGRVGDNPDDFTSRIGESLNRGRTILDALGESSVRDKYADKIEDRLLSFLRTVDGGNIEHQTVGVISDIDSILGQVGSGAEVAGEAEESVEDAQESVERAEAMDLAIDGESFDLKTPAGIVSAFNKVSLAQTSLMQMGKEMADKFQEAYGKIETANKKAQDAGVVNYVKSWFSDSSEKKDAEAAIGQVKGVFDSKLAEFGKQKEKIAAVAKPLADAPALILAEVNAKLTTLSGNKSEAENLTIEADRQRTALSERIEDLSEIEGGLKFNLEETLERIREAEEKKAEFERKKAELEKQKIEREAAKEKFLEEKAKVYEGLASDEQAKLDEEEIRFNNEISDVERQIDDITADIALLSGNLEILHNHKSDLERGVSDTGTSIDEAGTARSQAERVEGQASVVSQGADSEIQQLEAVQKGLNPLKDGIREQTDEWNKQNNDTYEQFAEWKNYLGQVEIDEPKFFRNFMYNIPVIGKWGLMGGLSVIGQAGSWLMDKGLTALHGKDWREWYADGIKEGKKVPGLNVVVGVLDGCKTIVEGLWGMVEKPYDALDGIVRLPLNIGKVAKHLVQYDEFAEGNYGYAVGRLAPDVAMLLTGVGAGAKAAEGASIGAKIANYGRTLKMAGWSGGAKMLGKSALNAGKGAIRVSGELVYGFGKFTMEMLKVPTVYTARLIQYIAKAGFKGVKDVGSVAVFLKYGMKGLARNAETAQTIANKQTQLASKAEAADISSFAGNASYYSERAAIYRGALKRVGVDGSEFAGVANAPSVWYKIRSRAGSGWEALKSRGAARTLRKVDNKLRKAVERLEKFQKNPPRWFRKSKPEALAKGQAEALSEARAAKLDVLDSQKTQLNELKQSLVDESASATVIKRVDDAIAYVDDQIAVMRKDVEAFDLAKVELDVINGNLPKADKLIEDLRSGKTKPPARVQKKGKPVLTDEQWTAKQIASLEKRKVELVARKEELEAIMKTSREKGSVSEVLAVDIDVNLVRTVKADVELSVRGTSSAGFSEVLSHHREGLRLVNEAKSRLADEMAASKRALEAMERELKAGGDSEILSGHISRLKDNIRSLRERYSSIKAEGHKVFFDAAYDGVLSKMPGYVQNARVVEKSRKALIASVDEAVRFVSESRTYTNPILQACATQNISKFTQLFRSIAKEWPCIPPELQYIISAPNVGIVGKACMLMTIHPEVYVILKEMQRGADVRALEHAICVSVEQNLGKTLEATAKDAGVDAVTES